MMGTFASAAGGAINSARFSGTLGSLAGVSSGLSNTLGRGRRASSYHRGSMRQTAKRVSFKGDNLAREGIKGEQEIHSHSDGDSVDGTDALSNCSYMHFNNFMDYQTTGFGGLPDVTEHSNARRTLSHQNSISNSDSGGEIASIEKSKGNFDDIRPPPLAHPANIKRKSKAAHQAVNDSCARVNHFKFRRCSCGIFLTLVAALCLLTIAAMLAYQHSMAPSRNSHAQRLRIVRRILKEVPLVDGHNNFAWNVRKYAQNSLEFVHTRQDPNAATLWTRTAWTQTDMERLKQGLVGAQMWSAYVPCEALGLDAVQIAIEQIDIIRRLTDMFNLDTVLVSSAADILTARKHDQMASLIAIKGGHAIGSSLAVLRSFYSVGARALSLTHRCDLSWASSSASESESGLSAFGKSVIREMNRLGMMVDLSYSSDATARDVLHVTRAPVIFSHSAARQLCNSTHNIPDDILRLVADNGGLIMVSFDPEDVARGQQAYISDVVQHINYIRAIAGVQHVGLGAGYDGIEIPPVGLENVSKYPELLATLLQDHNWSEQDIAMLAGKNFLRILETVENVRDYWKRADIQPLEQTEPQPKPHCHHKSS
ncbi:dipeptidase 1 [Eurosta solidaginis]|uniref:dipeptidase 1 n=1 Tax=Eurosta solidaginis TaxID=178769 RepID=UPI003530CE90